VDRGYSPKEFVSWFEPSTADARITRLFKFEFGPLRRLPRGGGQCCTSMNKR